jgi:hypothetical protein
MRLRTRGKKSVGILIVARQRIIAAYRGRPMVRPFRNAAPNSNR